MEILVNVDLDIIGMVANVPIIQIVVLQEPTGLDQLVQAQMDVEKVTIQVKMDVLYYLNNVLHHLDGMDQNALLLEAYAQKELMLQEINAILMRLVKMDLFGIQFILDVFALREQSTMVTNAFNVQMIKNGFLQ
jgi:hypothetical protein